MERILVSACLLGRPVRWDGGTATLTDHRLERWRAEGRIVAVCPEQLGGLPTPRPPMEFAPGVRAGDVLAGLGVVRTPAGERLEAALVAGARAAVDTALRHGCRFALLMDGSPSCGVSEIHDGHFAGRRIDGEGLTAHLLRARGVAVYGPDDLAALARRVDPRGA